MREILRYSGDQLSIVFIASYRASVSKSLVQYGPYYHVWASPYLSG
jgi:hypothetical protein